MAASDKKNKNKTVVSSSSIKKGNATDSSIKINSYSPWLILLFVFVIFLPALANGFVNWDDPKYILDNIYIKDLSANGIKAMFSSFYGGNYHPLTAISNALEFKLWGLNPKPYHFFNLVIHLANTLLVFKIIKLLCNDMRIALAVSLLFGIHPMHVESVAWISERKDVLYTFFYLIAIIKYIRFQEGKDTVKQYLFLTVAFLCALLSKSAAVALPLTLLLLDYFKYKKITIASFINKIPLFGMSLIFGIVAIHSQKADGALSDLTNVFSSVDRIFLISYSILFYLLKVIFPFNLTAFYAYPDKINNALPFYYYLSPIIIGLLFFTIYRIKKFRNELIFGFLFFLANIILVIQIVPVGQAFVAERYSYVPYIGLFFIIATLFFYMVDNFKNRKNYLQIGGIVFILMLSVVTFSRTKAWKDGVTLWTDVIHKNSTVFFAYYNLGNAYKNNKDFENAVNAYSGAIKLKPDYAMALYNRAHAYGDMQNDQAAIDDYTTLIKQSSKNNEEAYYNRAVSYATLKNYDAAAADYTSAIELNPKRADSYYSRGNMKAFKNLFEDAMADYTLAIQINPQFAAAFSNRGNCKLNLNRIPEACEDWKASVQLGNSLSANMINKYCNK